jgi:hypothetical protein
MNSVLVCRGAVLAHNLGRSHLRAVCRPPSGFETARIEIGFPPTSGA